LAQADVDNNKFFGGIRMAKRIIIENARKRGDDFSTSFARGVGGTMGNWVGKLLIKLIVVFVAIVILASIFSGH
jgi:hypothetical protein